MPSPNPSSRKDHPHSRVVLPNDLLPASGQALLAIQALLDASDPFDLLAALYRATRAFGVRASTCVHVVPDPERAAQLREEYDCVLPGFHMNKKHWNTIVVDGSIKDAQLREWIDHSYDLVVQALPRKLREQLS